MTETTWLSTAAVAALIKQANDEAAAREEIDSGLELRTIEGRFKKRIAIRSKGPRQSFPAGPLTPKLWLRVRAGYKPDDIWSRAEWRLPVSATEPETILGGVELNERHVRAALALHGVPDLPPPPVPKEPRKRTGGHNMSAHGAVISETVIELLNRPLHEVQGKLVNDLADELGRKFNKFSGKREAVGEDNRRRMARHLLANVIREMEQRAASGGGVGQVAG